MKKRKIKYFKMVFYVIIIISLIFLIPSIFYNFNNSRGIISDPLTGFGKIMGCIGFCIAFFLVYSIFPVAGYSKEIKKYYLYISLIFFILAISPLYLLTYPVFLAYWLSIWVLILVIMPEIKKRKLNKERKTEGTEIHDIKKHKKWIKKCKYILLGIFLGVFINFFILIVDNQIPQISIFSPEDKPILLYYFFNSIPYFFIYKLKFSFFLPFKIYYNLFPYFYLPILGFILGLIKQLYPRISSVWLICIPLLLHIIFLRLWFDEIAVKIYPKIFLY